MDDRQKDLSGYRLKEAQDSLRVAKHCLNEELYKDSINRSYYSAFYAIKSVLALGTVDFKRHKDVVAYFNQHYVATEIFGREALLKRLPLPQLRLYTFNYYQPALQYPVQMSYYSPPYLLP